MKSLERTVVVLVIALCVACGGSQNTGIRAFVADAKSRPTIVQQKNADNSVLTTIAELEEVVDSISPETSTEDILEMLDSAEELQGVLEMGPPKLAVALFQFGLIRSLITAIRPHSRKLFRELMGVVRSPTRENLERAQELKRSPILASRDRLGPLVMRSVTLLAGCTSPATYSDPEGRLLAWKTIAEWYAERPEYLSDGTLLWPQLERSLADETDEDVLAVATPMMQRVRGTNATVPAAPTAPEVPVVESTPSQAPVEDFPAARTTLRAACDAGDARGCKNLGDLWEKGLGGAKNEERAQEYFKKACEGGYSQSCKAGAK